MRKAETRARAAELGLSVAEKPDSQQICFVSSGSYGEFLSRRRPEVARPGPIVDREGRQLGRHRGIAFYTIGQRQGLRVARREPLHVVEIDAEGNRLVVGGAEELRARGLVMGEVNYVSMTSLPKEGHKVWSKIRYGARLAACTARPEGEGVRVEFVRRQRAVTPGQAAVCYEGEGRLPGEAVALGGTIESAL
jgi:tRNA-specific 2-thiouridylase